MAKATPRLAQAANDPRAAEWLLGLLLARPADEQLMAAVHDQLPNQVPVPDGYTEELSKFFAAAAAPNTSGFKVRKQLLARIDEAAAIEVAEEISDPVHALDPDLRLVALERCAKSKQAEARGYVFDRVDGLPAPHTSKALAALSTPYQAGEQSRLVEAIEQLASEVPAADLARQLGHVLPRLRDPALAQVLGVSWNPQLLQQIVADHSAEGLSAVLHARGRLSTFIERVDVGDDIKVALLSAAAVGLPEEELSSLAKWAYGFFAESDLEPIQARYDALLDGPERDSARDQLFKFAGISRSDAHADSLSSRVGLVDLPQLAELTSLESEALQLGRISARVVAGSDDPVGETEAPSAEGVFDQLLAHFGKSALSVAFWGGVLGDQTDTPPWVASRFVANESAVSSLARDHSAVAVAGAQVSEEPRERVAVMVALADSLSADDYEKLNPGWAHLSLYDELIGFLTEVGRRDLVHAELDCALQSRQGAQADRISTQQLVRLLDAATTLGGVELPEQHEDLIRDLLEDPSEPLLGAACRWVGSASGETSSLVRAVHDARRSRALANVPLDSLCVTIAERRLAVALDRSLDTPNRSQALRDAALLDRAQTATEAILILEDFDAPQALRAEAAEVLSYCGISYEQQPQVDALLASESLITIRELLERARTTSQEQVVNTKAERSVFLSYVHEDEESVDWLCEKLDEAGISYWRDRTDLPPGVLWEAEIRRAIQGGAFFLACFSTSAAQNERTYQRREVLLAIDELQLRPHDQAWFIPVLFEACEVPDHPIGGGRTLGAIQQSRLFLPDRDNEFDRLAEVLRADSGE